MTQPFTALLLGGTGQVGSAVLEALLAIPACAQIILVSRKATPARPRVQNVVLDTAAANFTEQTSALARQALTQGRVSAISCVGVGSGSNRWSEEDLKRLEIGVVGAFARGCKTAGVAQFCLLSAVGSSARSRFRYVRVMGLKEDTLRAVGFSRLAIFQPGIIVGNAHTGKWAEYLGKVLPSRFGNIHQQTLGRAIAAEVALNGNETGEADYENAAMIRLAGRLIS